MQMTDDPGNGDVGAGTSPSDPGGSGVGGRQGVGGAAGATDGDLVDAVEDLVRDLMADADEPEPATDCD